MTRILVIDNYDSFVFNIVQYLQQLGAAVDVVRNDEARFDREGWHEGFDGVLLSPGPGTPQQAGVCVDVVRRLAGTTPIFGVCLGLQAIAVAFGGAVERASEQLHGKVSDVFHDGEGVFRGLESPLSATRYHSLALVDDTLPDELRVTARTESGVVMALRHRSALVEAVQFHPESVLTEGGHRMLANWLADCGDDAAPGRAARLASSVRLPKSTPPGV